MSRRGIIQNAVVIVLGLAIISMSVGYAAFDTNLNISNEAILKGMNSFLPNNIIIKSVKKIKEDFHARFNVKRKQYVYKIKNSIQGDRFYEYKKQTEL